MHEQSLNMQTLTKKLDLKLKIFFQSKLLVFTNL